MSWDKTGYSAPTSIHAPVAHRMPLNFFNGALNVFVFGEDGHIHHIWQTTCDKVPNPWGWCTWSLWYKIGSAIPKSAVSANPLSIGANIHNGIEVMLTVPVKFANYFLLLHISYSSGYSLTIKNFKWISTVAMQLCYPFTPYCCHDNQYSL